MIQITHISKRIGRKFSPFLFSGDFKFSLALTLQVYHTSVCVPTDRKRLIANWSVGTQTMDWGRKFNPFLFSNRHCEEQRRYEQEGDEAIPWLQRAHFIVTRLLRHAHRTFYTFIPRNDDPLLFLVFNPGITVGSLILSN